MSTIVALHGWGMTAKVWQPLQNILTLNHSFIALDLPGYTGTACARTSYDFTQCTDELANTLKERSVQNCLLVGWSMGGLFAIALAQRYPNLVKKVLLLGCNPRFIATESWPGIPLAECEKLQDDLVLYPKRAMAGFAALQCRISPVIAKGSAVTTQLTLDKPCYQQALRASALKQQVPVATLQASLQCLMQTDCRAIVSKLKKQVFWVLADHDALVPSSVSELLLPLLPTRQLHRVATHHWGLLDPALIYSLIEELSTHVT